MSGQGMALVAVVASLIGLALGIDASFSFGLVESLCESGAACNATANSLLLGAPLWAWMTGLFLGLSWVSVSLWRNREGYQGAGKGLAFWAIATAALLGSRLSSAEEGTALQISIGAAVLVAVAGFISRTSESPSRATGAIAVCATAALLTGGTLSQTKALLSPWTPLDELTRQLRH